MCMSSKVAREVVKCNRVTDLRLDLYLFTSSPNNGAAARNHAAVS